MYNPTVYVTVESSDASDELLTAVGAEIERAFQKYRLVAIVTPQGEGAPISGFPPPYRYDPKGLQPFTLNIGF